jgi:hypothetical protein
LWYVDSDEKFWQTLTLGKTVAWCALPFPQYDLTDDFEDDGARSLDTEGGGHRIPGHGEARVLVNFWFFLFVYYGFYNVTALMWVTKVFNIYSLNWWPQSVGFPLTFITMVSLSIALPIPLYYWNESRMYLKYNTAWISWTFITMAMPVAVAFFILWWNERHVGLRQTLSDTQRIFTESWWAGDADTHTIARRDRRRYNPTMEDSFDADAPLAVEPSRNSRPLRAAHKPALGVRKVWIPASFMRFIWFCAALLIGLLAYVLGELYAEIYLRTLPHNSVETVFYVYSWVLTIHLLDGLTGWILGGDTGERVGSYPLGWVFKLYFSLTYQTYVRALYARLRSPQQFMLLQLLSSTTLIVLHPLTMSRFWHALLKILGFNNQPYSAYAKFCRRSVFIRTLAENVSMAAWLGQIVVLHFGANREVYPYFSFDGIEDGGGGAIGSLKGSPWPSLPGTTPGDGEGEKLYDFDRTVRFGAVTWACEIAAAWVVRRVVAWVYQQDVAGDGWGDLKQWPELVPASGAVMVHVLQNMLFGIIRIRFKEPW